MEFAWLTGRRRKVAPLKVILKKNQDMDLLKTPYKSLFTLIHIQIIICIYIIMNMIIFMNIKSGTSLPESAPVYAS